MPESIFDRRAAAGLVIDRADDLACVHHIVHVSADRDAGEVDLLGDLLAGKEAIPVVLQIFPDHGEGCLVQSLCE